MVRKMGPLRRPASIGHDENLVSFETIRNRTECLIQLLGAFHDIVDFDDIHQAAERLDAVQAWIKREARAAAGDMIFAPDDESTSELRVSEANA